MVILYFISTMNHRIYNKIKNSNQIICIQVFGGLANFVGGDEMITIQNPEIEPSATSFILSEKINFKALPLKPGDRFEMKGNSLCGEKLTFDFSGADLYDTTLHPRCDLSKDEDYLNELVRLIKSQIISVNHVVGIGNSLIYKELKTHDLFQVRFRELLSSFEKENDWDLDKFLIVIKKIIGLGAGLTPSGDDFLIGFMSVLRYYSLNETIENQLNCTMKTINEVIHKTTIVSRAFIKCALDGQFAQSIVDFYDAYTKQDANKQLISIKRIS